MVGDAEGENVGAAVGGVVGALDGVAVGEAGVDLKHKAPGYKPHPKQDVVGSWQCGDGGPLSAEGAAGDDGAAGYEGPNSS